MKHIPHKHSCVSGWIFYKVAVNNSSLDSKRDVKTSTLIITIDGNTVTSEKYRYP